MMKSYLRGNLGDLRTAETLYAEDRELDALKVLDKILGITGNGQQDGEHILSIMATEDDVALDKSMAISKDNAGNTILSVDHLKAPISNCYVTHLLRLRCMCFSALVNAIRTDKDLKERALYNCDLIFSLFPNHTEFLVLLSQVVIRIRSAWAGLDLLEKAVSMKPDAEHVRINVIATERDLRMMAEQGTNSNEVKKCLVRAESLVKKVNAKGNNEADPSNADFQQNLSANHSMIGLLSLKIGGGLREKGDLDGALKSYREALEVFKHLTVTDSSDADWQRAISDCQEKIGDVLHDQGDLTGAIESYRESLGIRERLAASDLSNTEWQWKLTLIQERVGNVLRDQGNLVGALKSYREFLGVIERLAASDPTRADWQQDLSICQQKIGDVLHAQGDLAGALKSYREFLGVIERLAASDHSRADWQQDLSICQRKIGDVLRDKGDIAGAIKSYRDSLGIRERLASSDPSNVQKQRDVSFIHERIEDMMCKQGDFAGATAKSISTFKAVTGFFKKILHK